MKPISQEKLYLHNQVCSVGQTAGSAEVPCIHLKRDTDCQQLPEEGRLWIAEGKVEAARPDLDRLSVQPLSAAHIDAGPAKEETLL